VAKTKRYRITWEDGTVRFRNLSEKDFDAWKKRADDKTSDIKSVQAGTPDAMNVTPAPKRQAG
jgi:hypothetical protein